jgi:hypothetical protein
MSDGFVRRSNADLDKKVDAEILVVDGTQVYRLRTQAQPAVRHLLFDDAGSSTFYIGRAVPGTATSAASWEIRKLLTLGNNVEILWADGDGNYDNIWDNRASLSYS